MSCTEKNSITEIKREQLFSLSYGVLEDQLNLFSLDKKAAPLQTSFAMRDGIFFVSNGNAAKILTLSSFGDLLSMVYNADKNPQPSILKPIGADEKAQGRIARHYPLNSISKIAVDSQRMMFVVDAVPESRRIQDEATNAKLEYVVLRFSSDGEYLDYLGQEGIGGTPFSAISSIYITKKDECIIISLTGIGWTIFSFDSKGLLLSTINIKRSDLPCPQSEEKSIISMDNIVASPNGDIAIKLNYFKEVIDSETRTQAGIDLSSSWLWIMDKTTGRYTEHYEIPAFISPSEKKANKKLVSRAWELSAMTSDVAFLSSVDDDGSTYYGLYNLRSKSFRRYYIRIDPDETRYMTFTLSHDGILSAMLASQYEARFVWWRFDEALTGLTK